MRRTLQRRRKPIAAALAVAVVALFTWAAFAAHRGVRVTFGGPAANASSWSKTKTPASPVPGTSFLGGYTLVRPSSTGGTATIDVLITQASILRATIDGLVAATTEQTRELGPTKGEIAIGKLGPVRGRPASSFSAELPAQGGQLQTTVTRYNLLASDGRLVSVICRWYHHEAAVAQQGCGNVFSSVRLHVD